MPDYEVLEPVYRQGMVEAEQRYGAEVRDYDRMLGGLGAVLAHLGLATRHEHGWHMELHEEFHYPLAMFGVDKPLARTCTGLGAVVQQCEPTRFGQDVAQGRLSAELDRTARGPAAPERLVRLKREASAQERALSEAGVEAANLRRRAEILTALLGPEHAAVTAHRTLAQEIEAGATRTREHTREALARMEQAVAQAPIERAGTLRPLAYLPVTTRRWMGNVMVPGRFICDEYLMLDTSVAVAGPLARLSAASSQPKMVDQARALAGWERAQRVAILPATWLGWLPDPDLGDLAHGFVAVESDPPVVLWVRADLLRLVAAVTGFDRLTSATGERATVVAWRGDTPVASLGTQLTPERMAVDVALARVGAAAIAALPGPAQKARRRKA